MIVRHTHSSECGLVLAGEPFYDLCYKSSFPSLFSSTDISPASCIRMLLVFSFSYFSWIEMFVSLQNSYLEILTPKVDLGGDWVMRVELS